MSKIQSIQARQILDSRGELTVEAVVTTADGAFKASVASGASKGKYEAVSLPAEQAIKNINQIIGPKLKGKEASEQKEIDQIMIELDSRPDKSRLGANAILAVSMACCRAGAAAKNLALYKYITDNTYLTIVKYVLPRPCFNFIEGGAHANNELDIQEFMVVPQAGSFAENFRIGKKIYQALALILQKKFGAAGKKLGDEAGFAPAISRTQQALDLLMEALTLISRSLNKCYLGLDCAGSQFYKTGSKTGGKTGGKTGSKTGEYYFEGKERSREEMIDFYQGLIKDYPIIFLEDPFAQDDWQAWQAIREVGLHVFDIIGDDLTVTNPGRIKTAKQKNACSGVVIKPNQIGTVSEAIEAAELAKSFGWKIMVSHRSGETNDDFIADLAVGIGADFIKAGGPAKAERLAKYNRLLEIEKQII